LVKDDKKSSRFLKQRREERGSPSLLSIPYIFLYFYAGFPKSPPVIKAVQDSLEGLHVPGLHARDLGRAVLAGIMAITRTKLVVRFSNS
jgi:hypothetical protein